MAEVNERAFDLANMDSMDEIYGSAAKRKLVSDYLMWAERVGADWQGAAKRFLVAEFEWQKIRHSSPSWSWRDNFVGGFDTLDEARCARQDRSAAEDGDRGGFIWDVQTDETFLDRDVPYIGGC